MAETAAPPQQPVIEQQQPAQEKLWLPPWLEQLWQDRRVRYGAIAVLVAVAAVLGYLLWRSSHRESEQEAALLLSRVLPYIEAQQYDQALNGDPKKLVRGEPVQGLLAIADTYGGTEAGKSAALYVAQIYFERKRYGDAERYFDHASDSDALLVRIAAQAGRAACYEQQNQFEKAAELYERILPEAETIGAKDKYILFAALCHEKAGKLDRARDLYRALLAEFEFSEYSAQAKAGLVRLGTVVEY